MYIHLYIYIYIYIYICSKNDRQCGLLDVTNDQCANKSISQLY